MQPARVRLVRHDSPQMQFELAFAAPVEALRMYVREYVGWSDRTRTLSRRRELPSATVPLIINFGSRVRERKAGSDHWDEYGTFTAGLHDAFTIVESAGPNLGIQVNFTAIGARLFYDRPLADFTNRTVELADIFGRPAHRLIDQLDDAASWQMRFDILDREIGSRIAAAREPARAVTSAWQALMRTGGRARIADLVREAGWSERHFAVQFRDHVGLAPKAFARILRFARAVRVLTHHPAPDLAEVAQACGYYDQAHFTRDFRAFAGTTPSALLRSRFPDHAGFRAHD
jgi:AraC-like DNA-binding protein